MTAYDEMPTTAAQRSIWLAEQLSPATSRYLVPAVIDLDGELDRSALGGAIQSLVDRHEALRTGFVGVDGIPIQRVYPDAVTALAELDVSAEADPMAAAEAASRRLVAQPFDLAGPSLLRATLIRVGPAAHRLVVLAHHLVCDAWSSALALRDLGHGYATALAGRADDRAPLEIQFADFAVWQQQVLTPAVVAEHVAHWRHVLEAPPAPLALPVGRRRATGRGGGGVVRTHVPPEQMAAVARASGATPYAVLLAALAVVLSRLTGQTDIVIGSVVATRDQPELSDVVGCLINTLPVRIDLSDDPGIGDLLARVRDGLLDAFEHRLVPFEQVLEELRLPRTPGRSPVSDVLATMAPAPIAPLDLPGLTATVRRLPTATAKADLTLEASPTAGGGVDLHVEYDRSVLDPEVAQWCVAALTRAIAAGAAAPDRPASTVDLLSHQERADLVAAANGPQPPDRPGSVWQRFTVAASRGGADTAVEAPDRSLTYAQLAAEAETLAARLIAAGVRPADRVGVCTARSSHWPVAVLGVLRARAAFVPLDPALPRARLAAMLADCGSAHIVADGAGAAALPAVDGLLRLDHPADGEPAGAGPPPRADDLAYVIYTSGSTGHPKGVAVEHASLVRLIDAGAAMLDLGPGDRVLQFASPGFDAAVLEFGLALLTGATLCLTDAAALLPGPVLRDTLHSRQITYTLVPPSALALVPTSPPLPHLRVLLTGGEAPDANLLRRWAGGRVLVNAYGPTEATIWATAWRCPDPDGVDSSSPPPMGRPLPGVSAHVLDAAANPVPAGVPGELYLGGANLARGYLGAPGLTASRFVPDPFGPTGGRLYRTGDRVVRRRTGELVFLGRIDDQVKIRGFRVEPGEAEHQLRAHPDVTAATVVADTDGEQVRLLGYYVARAGAQITASRLRAELAEVLPAYLIPAYLVELAALPLTASGKLDRAALPAPTAPSNGRRPAGELERGIAQIWCEVLGLDRVGAEDNFFDVGGHSLALARVHARLTGLIGREIPIVELFAHTTVADLARHLAAPAQAGPAPRRAGRPTGPGEDTRIAIIGMAGRFPGAPDVASLWRAIRSGESRLTRIDADDLRATGQDPGLLDQRGYVPVAGVLDDVECFDAGLFGYSAREAALLDPQHRHFLEICWTALESAGYDPTGIEAPVGVFAGARVNTYLLENLLPRRAGFDELGLVGLLVGNDKDFLATNVSYRLGLTGPSLTVQTACSTSLVATHLAGQSLLAGECDLALAGGVAIAVPHRSGYRYIEGGIYSPDGRCRPFAAGANGTVGGSGAAAVVLRRYCDALAAGDPILAVILGSAVNNDGRAKVGFTAPGVAGQTRAVADALAAAGVPASTIGYVEAHGTGTALGDPIEVAALTAAYRRETDRTGFCALGSVKANIGHLDAAAGVTGLIKAALVVADGTVPPSPYVDDLNPAATLAQSPFFVPRSPAAWPLPGPRRAGVSSFGIGGTNAHVVLEQAPEVAPADPAGAGPEVAPAGSVDAGPEVIVVSARTATALAVARANLARELAGLGDAAGIGDVAMTLQSGRTPMRHRFAAIAGTPALAAQALAAPARPVIAQDQPRIVFLLPGQGAHQPGVGAQLYATEPAYREAIQRCRARLAELEVDLEPLLAGDDPGWSRTDLAQPALFAIEYATACLWRSWGVRPDALVGHSLGEYVAAVLAGCLGVDDALAVVVRRGQLMQARPPGIMLAVLAAVESVKDLIGGDVALAAVNAPEVCVLSGPTARMAAVGAALAERGVATRTLATSHAFHSPMMDPVAEPLRSAIAAVDVQAPAIPLTSGLTGDWLSAGQAADPQYWIDQMRHPVRFADAVRTATASGGGLLVEIGPGHTLSRLAAGQLAAGWQAVAALGDQGEPSDALAALGAAWCAGASVDWAAVRHSRAARRIPLPTYPFERQRHWIDPPSSAATGPAPAIGAAAGDPGSDGAEPAAAGDPIAATVGAIWSQLLGVASIADTDAFYALGGHSLLGAQVLARLRTELGVQLTIDQVLAAPTFGELVDVVRAAPAASAVETLPRAERDPTGMPLSAAQQRLWVLEQLDPGTAVYHLPVVLRLRGRLDVPALSRALSTVVGRHEALRTRFAHRGGAAVQLVGESEPVNLDPEPTGRWRLDPVLRAEVRRPFDLHADAPVRFRLLRPGPGEHVLVVTLHHIVVDGWSVGVLVDELVRCYRHEADGDPLDLAPVTLHCADVAALPARQPAAADLGYWIAALADVEQQPVPPTDRPRPPIPSGAGGRVQTDLDENTVRALTAIAGSRQATLYMALLAGVGALLARLGGQSRLVIGTPVANRPQAELERVVGLLANTLPVPLDAGGDPTFEELLDRARDSATGAFAHGGVPFERIVAEVVPDRDLSRHPLVAVMLAVQNAPLPALRLPGLEIEPLDVHTGTAKFDLTIDATPQERGLRLSLEYSSDLWDPPSAQSLLHRLAELLRTAAADPHRRLHALPVNPPAAQAQVLAWGDGPAPPPAVTVTELVRRQIATTPDAIAVLDHRIRWTYAELGAVVTTIASRLAAAGVRRGDRVALYLPRDADGVATILAVLGLGAAYVPLDLSYPDARLAVMLARSGARYLVRRGSGGLAADGVTVLDLARPAPIDGGDGDPQRRAGGPDGPAPDDLAYVIFTSGSTGQPKGIGLDQRALANLVRWQVQRSALPPGASTAQLTPYSFDVHAQEILSTLAGGGILVVLADETRRDPDALLAGLIEHRIRRLFLPNVLLASLVDAARRVRTMPTELTEVITAGEQLQVTDAVRWFFARLPGAVLDNHYGPAETHVATAERLTGDPAGWPALPPIGRPLPGMRAYVADPSGAPAGTGVPGELWLSGVQLARGYVDDAQASARQFTSLPGDAGGHGYRTGDMVRWRADGRLSYLGRVDDQVKIRGQRIEPAEIEAVLGSHPQVRSAAVVALPGPGGRLRLVGYLTPSDVDAEELRAFLGQRLPAPLVPSLFVTLDALPRTPSGKIDRRHLPPPTVAASADSAAGPVDQRVADAWRQTLAVATVSGGDNFFACGGDSILAIALAATVSEAGLPMTPRDVFETQTAANLTASLRHRVSAAGPAAATAGRALVPPDSAMLAYRFEPAATAVFPAAALDPPELAAALRELTRAEPALRSRLVPPTPEWPQWSVVVADEHPGPLLAEIRLEPGTDPVSAAAQVRASVAAGLDPVRGPVFGAALCPLAGGDLFVLAAHPSLVDDASWPALVHALRRRGIALPAATHAAATGRRLAGRAGRIDALARRHRASSAQVITALLVRVFVHTPDDALLGYHARQPGDERIGQFGTAARITGSTLRSDPLPAAAALRAVKRAGPPGDTSTIAIRALTGAPSLPGGCGPRDVQWWRDGADLWLRCGTGIPADAVDENIAGAIAELANAAPAATAAPADYPLAGIGEDELAAVVAEHGLPEDIYPLTPMQRTMLARIRAGAAPGLFAVRTVDALPAAVDRVALRDAFAALVARHPILRTSFPDSDDAGPPRQIVHAAVDLPWTELDWRGVPTDQLPVQLHRFLAEDFGTPFDLTRAPLLRFTLIRLPGGAYQLVFTGHHLLTDGWSRALLLSDVPALYAAALAARSLPARMALGVRQLRFAARLLIAPAPRPRLAELRAAARPSADLPARPRPFRDHVAATTTGDAAGADEYWTGYLAGLAETATAVPEQPEGTGYRRLAGALSPADAESLAASARANRVTVAAMAQAAWALVLARRTGATQVMFGVTSSGRRADLAGYERMVGLFITTLPQRVSIDARASVAELVRAIQTDSARTRRYEEVALADLERAHSPDGGPLFDTVVVVDNFPQDTAQHRLGALLQTGHPFAGEHFDLGMTEFALRLEVIPIDGLRFALCHHRERHGDALAQALLAEFAATLRRIARDPQRPVGQLLESATPASTPDGPVAPRA